MDKTKIHRSRKGTQLNDAHYFRRPLPHARKRMTMMKIFPTLSDKKKSADPPATQNSKKKKRFNNLDIEQPSTEITLVSYDDQSGSDQSACVSRHDIIPNVHDEGINHHVELDKDTNQQEIINESSPKIEVLKDNSSVGTIKSEMSKEVMSVMPEENSIVEVEVKNDDKVAVEVEVEAETKEVKDLERKVVVKKVEEKKEIKKPEEYFMSVNSEEKLKEDDNNNKSWWKVIVDFFGSLVGKRDGHDKGFNKNDNMRELSKTITLVTAKPGNPNIYQAYVSALGGNKDNYRMERELRIQKMKKNQHYHSEKELKNRKISSPL